MAKKDTVVKEKKAPFISESLLKKVEAMNETGKKEVLNDFTANFIEKNSQYIINYFQRNSFRKEYGFTK